MVKLLERLLCAKKEKEYQKLLKSIDAAKKDYSLINQSLIDDNNNLKSLRIDIYTAEKNKKHILDDVAKEELRLNDLKDRFAVGVEKYVSVLRDINKAQDQHVKLMRDILDYDRKCSKEVDND